MPNRAVKIETPRGLDLFYAMYAVGLVFGIEQISDSLYKNIKALTEGKIQPYDFALNVGIFLAILLLIIRFFWSTGNIKRAWQRTHKTNPKFSLAMLVLHLPVLLVQGVLVLFVCFAFTDRLNAGPDSLNVIAWFLCTTAWNAIWLIVLARGKFRSPESLWIINNLLLAAIGVGLLIAGQRNCFSPSEVVVGFIVASITSSLIDLCFTADSYLKDVGR